MGKGSLPFDLIIWDCDGCLVDSEVIACGVPAALATARGFPITTQEYIARFAGRTAGVGIMELAREQGVDLGDSYEKDVYQATLDGFTAGLKPIPGLADILRQIPIPMCVASGSSLERNRHALGLVGLLSFFDGRIYSSSQVAYGKPAPDVFLFAASQMNAVPSRCLVIEDSVPGIQAAKAAGMKVYAYMGGSHVDEVWRKRLLDEKPDQVLADYTSLGAFI